jgi:signal peptidase I
MLGSYEQYRTTTDAYSIKSIFKFIVKLLLVLCILFIFISGFIADTYRIGSLSMSPSLTKGDMLVTSPLIYGTYSSLFGFRFPGLSLPHRGDVVVIKTHAVFPRSFFSELIKPFLTFFRLESAVTPHDAAGHPINEYEIKRIVGIPGDAIKIEHFTVYIKPKGRTAFIEEKQLAGNKYKINNEFAGHAYPAGWENRLPFSGNMQEIILGPDEYFVLGDNRLLWSDARFFGPVKLDSIVSKVVLRYWPFEKFGGL